MSYVVVNAVTVPEERKQEFETRFAGRAGTVSTAPGFEAFELLRPTQDDRYLVYTRWATKEDFEAWRTSRSFAEGHRQHQGEASGPISSESEVWLLEVIQAEYAG